MERYHKPFPRPKVHPDQIEPAIDFFFDRELLKHEAREAEITALTDKLTIGRWVKKRGHRLRDHLDAKREELPLTPRKLDRMEQSLYLLLSYDGRHPLSSRIGRFIRSNLGIRDYHPPHRNEA